MRSVTFTGATGALAPVPSPFLYYRGFSLRETGGAVASIVVWDSLTAPTGQILDEISFIANESARENYGVARVAKVGIYIQVVAGTVAGQFNFD